MRSDNWRVAERPDPSFRYLSVNAAARYLGRSDKALYRLVGRREIPFIKQGRRLLFDRVALDKWMARGKVDAVAGPVVHSSPLRESAPEERG